jgi:catechol 2,3-dioxygenase-like lactoylglutathione lyase family enzyme
MPKIKHIAVTTNDLAGSAEFYKGAFGLKEILRDDEKVILTDGYIVFALLVFEADKYGGGRPGLHHFGFEIDDMDAIEEKMRELGGRETTEYNETYGNREGMPDNWVGEKKWTDPQGVAFDINPTGWGH